MTSALVPHSRGDRCAKGSGPCHWKFGCAADPPRCTDRCRGLRGNVRRVAVQYQTTFQGSIDALGSRASSPKTHLSEFFSVHLSHSKTRGDSPCGAPGCRFLCSRVCGACCPPPASLAAKRTPVVPICCLPDGFVWSTWCCARRQHWPGLLCPSQLGSAQPWWPRALTPPARWSMPPRFWASPPRSPAQAYSRRRSCRRGRGRSVSPWACSVCGSRCGCSRTACITWPGWRGQPRSGLPPLPHRTPTTGPPRSSSWQAWHSGSPWPVWSPRCVGMWAAGWSGCRLDARLGPGCWDRSWDSRSAARYDRPLDGPLASRRTTFSSERSSRRYSSSSTATCVRGPGRRCRLRRPQLGDGFAAALFALLSVATGLYAAARLAAMIADESPPLDTGVVGPGTAKPLGIQ